jgi:3-methyl-2-oxobutanoate hydroxymethyltransferase
MNLVTLQQKKAKGEKIVALTCYDASFASLLDSAGIEVLLVGDSLGMVLHGKSSTLSVTLHDMQYHTRCVAQGNKICVMQHASWLLVHIWSNWKAVQ